MVLVASPCVQGCDSDTPLYIAQNSATALTSSKPFNINYQIGSASGTVARDSISFAGYTNPRQVKKFLIFLSFWKESTNLLLSSRLLVFRSCHLF